MESIDFSCNWNKKLDCKTFTTFRVQNPRKYKVGTMYRITVRGHLKKFARIRDMRRETFYSIDDWKAYLDTGYNKEEFQQILIKMYGSGAKNQDFALLLLDTVSDKEIAANTQKTIF